MVFKRFQETTKRTLGQGKPIAFLEFALRPRVCVAGSSSSVPLSAYRPLGRIEIELYDELCPMASDNFLKLCTGTETLAAHDTQTRMHESTFQDSLKPQLGYQASIVHRIVKGLCVQGGDIVRYDGTGQASIFGETFSAPSELGAVRMDRRGLVATACSGPHMHGSQYFFLTAAGAPHLDGSAICFGCIVRGLDVLDRMEALAVDYALRPKHDDVVVVKSGTV